MSGANWAVRGAVRGGRGWCEPAVLDAGLGGGCNGARESGGLGSPSGAGAMGQKSEPGWEPGCATDFCLHVREERMACMSPRRQHEIEVYETVGNCLCLAGS